MSLLFIPAAGSARAEWAFQTAHFPTAQVVVLPGHPEGTPCPSIAAYTDWLHSYVQQKGYNNVVLCGHSMGGAVVLQYALSYPDRLKAIILIGAGAKLRVHPAILASLECAKTDTASWRRMLEYEFRNIPPTPRQKLLEEGLGMGAAVALNNHLCCDSFDVMDRVHQITLPALIIVGSNDDKTPIKYADFLASRLPHAQKVIIDGGDHWVHVECPDEVNQAIQEFLENIR